MLNIKKFLIAIGLVPKGASQIDTQGELEVLSTDGKLRYHNGTSVSPVVTESHPATLSNKEFIANQSGNQLSNIDTTNFNSSIINTDLSSLTPPTDLQIPTALAVKNFMGDVETNVDDLITLSGVPENAQNLGIFTGTTIPDNQTIKQSLQALETSVEGKITNGASLGAGVAVFDKKNGTVLDFKSLIAGSNITLTSNSTSITIDSTGGGGGTVLDATTTTKGIIKLAGALGGTADLPTVPGLSTKLNKNGDSTTGTYTFSDSTSGAGGTISHNVSITSSSGEVYTNQVIDNGVGVMTTAVASMNGNEIFMNINESNGLPSQANDRFGTLNITTQGLYSDHSVWDGSGNMTNYQASFGANSEFYILKDSLPYTPINDQDIATKKYVDDNAGGGGGAGFLSSVSTVSGTSYNVSSLNDDGKLLLVDTATNTVTINLPTTGVTAAFKIVIKDFKGNCGTRNITVTKNASHTIERLNSSYICESNFGTWTFIFDGTSNWSIL